MASEIPRRIRFSQNNFHISFQVNAGPLAYAETFLDESVVNNYMTKHIEALQQTYRWVAQ